MGWSIGYDSHWRRDIGYGVPALCDHPRCHEEIDRGLAHVCGGQPYGGDHGCGLYFCPAHLSGEHSLCARCLDNGEPFPAKPDLRRWVQHKLTHPSWARWRAENITEVAELTAMLQATRVGDAAVNPRARIGPHA